MAGPMGQLVAFSHLLRFSFKMEWLLCSKMRMEVTSKAMESRESQRRIGVKSSKILWSERFCANEANYNDTIRKNDRLN